MKLQTVTYRTGYKASLDFNSVEGVIEAKGLVEACETEDEAYKALRKQVRIWIRADYETAKKILGIESTP